VCSLMIERYIYIYSDYIVVVMLIKEFRLPYCTFEYRLLYVLFI